MATDWKAKIESLPEPARSEARRISEALQGGVIALFSLPEAERINVIERAQKNLDFKIPLPSLGDDKLKQAYEYVSNVLSTSGNLIKATPTAVYDMMAAANSIRKGQADLRWLSSDQALELGYLSGKILESRKFSDSAQLGIGQTAQAYFMAAIYWLSSVIQQFTSKTSESRDFDYYLQHEKSKILADSKLQQVRDKGIVLREELQKVTFGEGERVTPQLAQFISGVDNRDTFIKTGQIARLPAFVDPKDKELTTAIVAEQKKKNPDAWDHLTNAFSTELSPEALAATATGLMLGGYVVRKGATTVSSVVGQTVSNVRSIAGNVVERAKSFVPKAPYVNPATRMAEQSVARWFAEQAALRVASAEGSVLTGAAGVAARGLLGRAAGYVLGPLGILLTSSTEVASAEITVLNAFARLVEKNPQALSHLEDEDLKMFAGYVQENGRSFERLQAVSARIATIEEEGIGGVSAKEELAKLKTEQADLEQYRSKTFGNWKAVNDAIKKMLQEKGWVSKDNPKEVSVELVTLFEEAQKKALAKEAKVGDKVSSLMVAPALADAHERIIEQTRAAARSVADAGVLVEDGVPSRPFARVSDVKLAGVTRVENIPDGDTPRMSSAPAIASGSEVAVVAAV